MNEQITSRATCRLIHVLKRLEGEEDVNIRTIGGFQFNIEGRLARVEDKLALGTSVEVFTPGSDDPFDLNNITINLCAITSVGQDD